MDTLLENVISSDKKDIIIQDEGIVYQITTTDNQKYNVHYNISSISLGECEDILRFQYKINKTTPLIVLKIEIYPEGISIPMIEYEVYDSSTNKQLDLDKCKSVKMDIILPVDIDYKNVFKYNMSSEYYNDICETFTTESGTDIIIADRKKEFNKNKNKMSICEEKCELTGYNSTTKSAKCECQVKSKLSSVSDIIENKDKILNDFMDIKNKTNFQILKCYNKLFTKQGIEKNIGNYILLSIILIHFICLIRFIFPEYKRWSKKIDKIIQEKKKIFEIKTQILKTSNKNRKKSIKIKKNNNKNKISSSISKNSTIILKSNRLSNENKDAINKLNTIKTNSENKVDKNKNKNKNENKNKKINDYELNLLQYKDALKNDKRTYFQCYLSLLKRRHILIFTFFLSNDYNIKCIKKS